MTAEIGATQQGLVSTQIQQTQTDVPTAAQRPEPPPAVEPPAEPPKPTPPPADSGRGTNVDTTA